MVAKITFPKRVQDALKYNEQKVQKGVAECLYTYGYLHKGEDLNFYRKLEGLELRNSLNERATTKTVHVSLNFSPQDRKLDTPTLIRIAKDYMHGIGFGTQPYLVYCHRDAGHPHLHIVSTTIRADGSRIRTHNLGRDLSSKTRVQLEQKYNLIPAKGKTMGEIQALATIPAGAQYGKEESKAAIARVVSHVSRHYAFSSLPEYNAALCAFGVVADRGSEGSRTFRHGGLVYRMLNEGGEKVGVPIKASELPGKPMLPALEIQYVKAAQKKAGAKLGITSKLDTAIKASSSFQAFMSILAKEQVFVLPRQNKGGPIYGITFVDHRSRCVFNGSDLGKQYSAAALLARLPQENTNKQAQNSTLAPSHQKHLKHGKELHKNLNPQGKSIEQILSAPGQTHEVPPPSGLIKKRKRKQHRTINS